MINKVLGKSPLSQTLTPSDTFSIDKLKSGTNPFDPINEAKQFKKWEKRSDKAIKADKRQQERIDNRDFRQERRRNRIEQTGGSKIGNWQRDKVRASKDLNAIFDAPKFIDGKEMSFEEEIKHLGKNKGTASTSNNNTIDNTGVASTDNLGSSGSSGSGGSGGGTNYNPNQPGPHIRVAGDYYKKKEYKDIVLGGSGGTPTQST